MLARQYCDTPIGGLLLQADDTQLIQVEFVEAKPKNIQPNSITELAAKQLRHFFQHQQTSFELPLKLEQCSAFQQRVLKALLAIPYGEVKTYGELAAELNTSARAIGNACRRNPLPVVIPCHRVVAKHGIGGFAGATEGELIGRKQTLLAHERNL